jgi:cell wall-associated NlpC family hydrolase
MATALGVGLVPAVNAHAAPSPEEIERQLDAEWQKLEPIIEQYNAVTIDLKANQAKAEALRRQLEPLQAQIDVAMGKVGAVAAKAYKGGRVEAINAILGSAQPDGLASQLGALDALARNQRQEISGVAAARDKYANDKKALDQLIAQQSAQEAELAAQRTDIEAKIADLEKLRLAAYAGRGVNYGDLKPTACPAESGPVPGSTAARVACAQIGKTYVYAAEGPDHFDCSGLTLWGWKAAGRSLPHNARAQYGVTQRITKDQLRIGDLVYFYPGITHVGMYVGQGYMVHASRPGQPIGMRKIDAFGREPIGYGRVGG